MRRQQPCQAPSTSRHDSESDVEGGTAKEGNCQRNYPKYAARRRNRSREREDSNEDQKVTEPQKVAAVYGNVREVWPRGPFGPRYGIFLPRRAAWRFVRIDHANLANITRDYAIC